MPLFQGLPHLSYSIKALKLEQEDPPSSTAFHSWQLLNQSTESFFALVLIINSNNTPLQQQQETAAAPPQDPHSRQQPF
jgi:hypothetical protein